MLTEQLPGRASTVRNCFQYSTIGHRKTINEDGVCCNTLEISGKGCTIGIVIDGVSTGGRGSQARDELLLAWQAIVDEVSLNAVQTFAAIQHIATVQLQRANRRLYHYNRIHRDRGYAAFSLFIVFQGQYLILHIGDTRIYLVGQSQALLTRDHTLNGGHALTNAIGLNNNLAVEVFKGDIHSADYLIALSDGAQIAWNDMVAILRAGSNFCTRCHMMTEQLSRHFLHDNASFIVVDLRSMQ